VAKLWDVNTGKEMCTFKGHTGEIVSLNFNAEGDKLVTVYKLGQF
jgi:dynein assembly factor with WDR repeat domains 1